MSDIFISYKREEQPEARRLADALEREGWTVWWDPRLRAGEHYDEVIEKALTEASCVIVMWSERSVQSRYVREEAAYALERDKLIPVEIQKVNLPFRFRGVHTLSLRDWDGSNIAPDFRELIADISELLHQSAKHTVTGGVASAEASRNQLTGRTAVPKTRPSRLLFGAINIWSGASLKSKVAAALLGIALLVAAGLYPYRRVVQDEVHTSHSVQRSPHPLIVVGSEKAVFICREIESLRLKRDGLAMASQIDSSIEVALKRQIGELQKNIEDGVSQYSDFVNQLLDYKTHEVANEFDDYAATLVKKGANYQISRLRIMKRHYEQFVNGNRTVDAGLMEEQCKE
jgi:TIR domain